MTPSAAAGGAGGVRVDAGAGGGAAGGGGAQSSAGTSGASAAAPSEPANKATQDRDPTPADFTCIRGADWTQVGNTRYKNYLGHTDEMLAVARSKSGGVFPVGTIVQLVPTEASVKRAAGFSAASHDWEFFNLTAASSGTTIGAHGGDAKVINSFGLSCLDCHQKAAPQWDLLCGSSDGQSHGCDPLPFSGEMLAGLEDARCQ
jgi:hypothetical protein